MAVACASVATARRAGRCIGFTLFPKVPIQPAGRMTGLGTFYPPHARRERTEVNDPQFQTWCRFGRSSPASRKTRVSCTMVTTVLTNVHLCFPYPLPHQPPIVLLDGSGSLSQTLCPLPGRLLIRGSARLDCSSRTHGRGHFVPEVVSVKETRHLERCRSLAAQRRGGIRSGIFQERVAFRQQNSLLEGGILLRNRPGGPVSRSRVLGTRTSILVTSRGGKRRFSEEKRSEVMLARDQL
jgi:hypothetical protein